jgi:hypothetical protein
VRHLNGDDGNSRLEESRRDYRSNAIEGLEFQDNIDPPSNEHVRIVQRHAGTVAVVHDDQFDIASFGDAVDALRYQTRKGGGCGLGGKTDAEAAAAFVREYAPKLIGRNTLQHAAGDQRGEKTMRGRLSERGALDDISQSKVLIVSAKAAKDGTRP